MKSRKLPFIVEVPDLGETKGLGRSNLSVEHQQLPIEILQTNLQQACEGLSDAFSGLKQVGDFKLKQVTIGIEVSAEGGISFVGTAKAGARGAITLTFEESQG